MKRRLVMVGFGLGLTALFAGCGKKASPLVEVEGTVRINGKPAGMVWVKFMPDLARNNRGQYSEGTTDAEGHYRLVCYKQGDGAAIGWHKVILSDLDALNQRLPPRKHRIAGQFYHLDSTPLQVEVKPEPPKQTIDLEANPPS